jgi:hypothetical protein
MFLMTPSMVSYHAGMAKDVWESMPPWLRSFLALGKVAGGITGWILAWSVVGSALSTAVIVSVGDWWLGLPPVLRITITVLLFLLLALALAHALAAWRNRRTTRSRPPSDEEIPFVAVRVSWLIVDDCDPKQWFLWLIGVDVTNQSERPVSLRFGFVGTYSAGGVGFQRGSRVTLLSIRPDYRSRLQRPFTESVLNLAAGEGQKLNLRYPLLSSSLDGLQATLTIEDRVSGRRTHLMLPPE